MDPEAGEASLVVARAAATRRRVMAHMSASRDAAHLSAARRALRERIVTAEEVFELRLSNPGCSEA